MKKDDFTVFSGHSNPSNPLCSKVNDTGVVRVNDMKYAYFDELKNITARREFLKENINMYGPTLVAYVNATDFNFMHYKLGSWTDCHVINNNEYTHSALMVGYGHVSKIANSDFIRIKN
jgi:hypothetical protein